MVMFKFIDNLCCFEVYEDFDVVVIMVWFENVDNFYFEWLVGDEVVSIFGLWENGIFNGEIFLLCYIGVDYVFV